MVLSGLVWARVMLRSQVNNYSCHRSPLVSSGSRGMTTTNKVSKVFSAESPLSSDGQQRAVQLRSSMRLELNIFVNLDGLVVRRGA